MCCGGTWSQQPQENDTQHVTAISGGLSGAVSHGVQHTELGARPLTPTVGSAGPLGCWPLPGHFQKSHSPGPSPQAGPHCTQGPCSGPSSLGHQNGRTPQKHQYLRQTTAEDCSLWAPRQCGHPRPDESSRAASLPQPLLPPGTAPGPGQTYSALPARGPALCLGCSREASDSRPVPNGASLGSSWAGPGFRRKVPLALLLPLADIHNQALGSW